MKQKIKLRDLTKKQFERWLKDNCGHGKYVDCPDCPFFFSNCVVDEKKSWVKNKDLYSDKFLDIEIEIADEPLLTAEEKKYLENFLKPFKEVIDYIMKIKNNDNIKEYIAIRICNGEIISLPYFNFNEYYKNMKPYKKYTLEQLGLFEE